MTFEHFAVAVHDWVRRLPPRQFRAEVARQLASEEGVGGLRRGISIEAALVMVQMGLGPGMRPVRPSAPRCENVGVTSEPEPLPPRQPRKAASGTGQELCGRPSKRAQALVREQLADGPKRSEDVQAAADAVEISERTLIAAASALGVRTRRGQWWLPTVVR